MSTGRILGEGKRDVHHVLYVALGLRELHDIHAFAGVPVQKSAALVHRGKLHDSFREFWLVEEAGVTH